MRCQMVYFQQELNVAGKVTSFSLKNSYTQGYFYNVKVKLCNTGVNQLSSHFADNYGGNAPATVLTAPVMLVGSGQYETWYPFVCSAPFCYYNTGNLLIEFTWNGDNGNDVDFYTTENGGGGRVWTGSDTASNGTPENVFMYARVGFIPFRLQGNLLSPDGGELWPGGASRAISWTVAPEDFDHGRLLLSSDGGGTFPTVLATSVPPSETTDTISVPAVNSPSCRVKFQAMDSTGEIAFEDVSDSNFTIDSQDPSAPALIYPPNGGAVNMQSGFAGTEHPTTYQASTITLSRLPTTRCLLHWRTPHDARTRPTRVYCLPTRRITGEYARLTVAGTLEHGLRGGRSK
jgi:hypothetical protein